MRTVKKNRIFNKKTVAFIRSLYGSKARIALHVPTFRGNEQKYLKECITSSYVSYVGEFVNKFERSVAAFTGARFAVAVVNGTCALHLSLKAAGVSENDEVITQPLTFIATVNAIRYCGAQPLFLDIDRITLGLSAQKLKEFLQMHAVIKKGRCFNKITGKRIAACVPVHVFGHPAEIEEISRSCKSYKIPVIEDAAEALGSFYNNKHCGIFGEMGVLSFNGNKIVTTGGGGMILTNNARLALKLKHLSTTAKVPHPWKLNHDAVGFNYRMPNINAALGCAQMEQLPGFLSDKREVAKKYKEFFKGTEVAFIDEPKQATSNFWLNAILFKNSKNRDEFLEFSNASGVMSRPAWRLMNELPMFKLCFASDLGNARFISRRLVNVPSGVR